MEAINECVRKFTVEIPWNEVSSERKRLIGNVAARTVIPGFRKGRAPASVLYRHYETEIRHSLLDGVVKMALFDEIRQHDWRLAYGPVVNDFQLVDGRPLVVEALVEVFPDFELGDYRKLRLPDPDPRVTEAMVDEQLERLRHRHASYRNLDPRPIRDGDLVSVIIEGTSGGRRPEIERRESHIEVGEESTLPAFNEALLGMSPGERTQFDATYPPGHQVKELSGKTLHINLEVQSIMDVELPEFDDEFAKDIDHRLEDFEALRRNVRSNMELHLQEYAMEAIRREAMRQLAEAHPMPLPPNFILQQLQANRDDTDGPNGPDLDPAELQSILETRVRADLVLERIADEEGISISDEDTDNAIREFAHSNQLTVDTARKQLEEGGKVAAWRSEQRRNRALQLVIDQAERVALVSEAQRTGQDTGEAVDSAG